MKLKNLEQELEFIRSAEPKKLYAYIKANHFSHTKAEKEMVKYGCSKAVKLYILKYGLQSGARIAVFRQNNLELVQLLLQESSRQREILAEFLTHGVYHTIRQYLQKCEESLEDVFPEWELLECGSTEDLLRFASHHRLTALAKYELIRRRHPLIIRAVIKKGRLNEREKLAVMEFADWEETDFLIAYEKKPEQQRMLREMQLIRFSHSKKLAKYVAKRRLSKNAESFFFKYAEFSLLVRYIKHYNVKGGQEIIINRAKPTEILRYLSQNWLCESGEKLLLDRRKHREIKTYIKSHYFTEENETRFIKRGRHNEIMLYISRHSLCDTAQCELMYRRNSSEINYFVSHYPLANIAEAAFLRCAPPETRHIWQENIPYLSRQTKNHIM